ncbi:MAG: carbamoyl-phosphate synthase large subunit [Candidatus Scatomorpha sp.]|jgi:carbamoyl-phosphate synthase large subunit
MPKRTDLKKILIIGSGPIVIGQGAEFDYAGTQACLAIKEEGYELVLVNSNPATIMTDTNMADKVYMEPLTLEYLAKILRYERPDGIIAGLGGQTALNLAIQLEEKGVLKECKIELLGTSSESIKRAEDRDEFKALCQKIGEPVIPSEISYNTEHAKEAAKHIGYPVVLRPAFTLGGTGGGFAESEEELIELCENAFALSPINQVLLEKSVRGFVEIEFEVMRDSSGKCITVCGMENVDPVGVHTGDSIVVAPILTLSEEDKRRLNESAIKILKELSIAGGCNVQFAFNPVSREYYLIEINPRVSRSSALASKATAYPIARVSAKIAIGMNLDEIEIGPGMASEEPQPGYIISKVPRFPFDKFENAATTLGTQMKATGEVMGIGMNFSESLLKGLRSLEIGIYHIYMAKFDSFTDSELFEYIAKFNYDNIYAIAELFRRGAETEKIHEISKISDHFLNAVKEITELETALSKNIGNTELLTQAKKLGFSDRAVARFWKTNEDEIFKFRKENKIFPEFKMVNSKNSKAYIPYFFSTYNAAGDSVPDSKKKIIVLGSGPIRIGQGVEFDYSSVHAISTIRRFGQEAIIINNNPETVSTDYNMADKLYFEPLTTEDVMNIVLFEKPDGVIASLGGQTAINLANSIMRRGVRLIGTDCDAIEMSENRENFEKLLANLGIPHPQGKAVLTIQDGIDIANEVGFPVLVRPSFVLGGRAMQIVANEEQLRHYLSSAFMIDSEKPVLVDKYIYGKEVELDAVCDGTDVFVPGIMELVERTGVHSGDSISVYPPFSISDSVKGKILSYTKKLALESGIIGLCNIQYIVDKDENVYVIEINPRSSRTVPFLSKATGFRLADIATEIILGKSLKEQGIFSIYPEEKKRYYVKVPVFSSNKIRGLDAYLSPEMKSTGEAIGYDDKLNRALYKALQASGMKMQNYGTVLATIADSDKEEALPLIRRFYNLGFNIVATRGTAGFLKKSGIRTRALRKISEGSSEIPEAIRQGHIAYIINTGSYSSMHKTNDGREIRKLATEHNANLFTALDTVNVLLDVLEETTLCISTIDE